MRLKGLLTLALIVAFISACDDQDAVKPQSNNAKISGDLLVEEGNLLNTNVNLVDQLNLKLADAGTQVRVQKVEMMMAEAAGATIFASDNTLRLLSQWAANDSRRIAQGKDITYLTDEGSLTINKTISSSGAELLPAIDASFDTWMDETDCSSLNLVKREFANINPNYVLALITEGQGVFLFGDPFQADIITSGYLPGNIFSGLFGSNNILGVCFTLIFVNPEDGSPTDINNDGYTDVALKEVWYNDAFAWSNDGSTRFDIETVALHENGHALGHAHNGKIFITNYDPDENPKNEKLHVASRAVMTASYLGPLRNLLGTDKATHCSLYSDKQWR